MIDDSNLENDLLEQIMAVSANGAPIQIIGGNSKGFYGESIEALPIDVSGHSGIIDYDPAELVITLRGGCKLKEVEALLLEHKQMFAFEAPIFDGNTTIGGMIASGLCGPRRAYAGNIRDFVLGIKILDGKGQILSFGGRVIKNVAGFDLSRVMVGAMGSLGIILEASIRVIPTFQTEVSLALSHDTADQHIDWINQLGSSPYPLSASSWYEGISHIRLSGSEQGVNDSLLKIGGEQVDYDWKLLRHQHHDFFKIDQPITRIAVKPTTRDLADGTSQLIEWGGAQRWLNTDQDIDNLRSTCKKYSGNVCAYRNHSKDVSVFDPLPPAILTLQRKLKSSFDPGAIFNPGKLYPQL